MKECNTCQKNETFHLPKSLPISSVLMWFGKRKKAADGIIYDFWVFNVTICMRELQDSRVIEITHETDI